MSCENIWVDDLTISACTGCGYCDDTGTCVIQDDMHKVYQKVEASKIIAFITPIYFGSMTGQLKVMIDRFQPYYASKYLLNAPRIPQINDKKAALIVLSGMKRQRFFENAKEIAEIFCINANIALEHTLYLGNVDAAGDVLKKPGYVNKIKDLAQLL